MIPVGARANESGKKTALAARMKPQSCKGHRGNGVLKSIRQKKWCQKIMKVLPQRRIQVINIEGRNEKSFNILPLNITVITTAGKTH